MNPLLVALFTISIMLGILELSQCAHIGPPVSAEEGRNIQTCVEACKAFRDSFHFFGNLINLETWSAAKNQFTTCQYRCYKCSLKEAITAIEAIDKFNFPAEDVRQYVINFQQVKVVQSIQECTDKWKVAVASNCGKTPVEDTVDLVTKNCK